MGDVFKLGASPDAETSLRELVDLQRRFADGEDLGCRVPHMRQAMAALRSLTGGLRRAVDALDPAEDGAAEIRHVAETVLAHEAENLAKAEELLLASSR